MEKIGYYGDVKGGYFFFVWRICFELAGFRSYTRVNMGLWICCENVIFLVVFYVYFVIVRVFDECIDERGGVVLNYVFGFWVG